MTDLPPLYKFLSVQGAKLTLGNGTFRHAKPSDFNDTEDLTVGGIFPDDAKSTNKAIADCFVNVILEHLNDEPTCGLELAAKLAILQHVYRTNPAAAELVKEEAVKLDPIDLYNEEQLQAFVNETNAFLQGHRVLCVTTALDSIRMWEEYAESSRGVAIRIEPALAKDSKFRLFRPVRYQDKRPPLYECPRQFVADSLFANQHEKSLLAIEKIVYAKTLKWQHENEYRLVIPAKDGEADWDTLPYHPEEIAEIYMGNAMLLEDRAEILALAKARNPAIKIFSCRMLDGNRMAFIQG